MNITFLGATEQVTGSRYLIEQSGTRILVDCGLFQGGKESYKRNVEPFAVDPSSIDALIITHAHIDHTGYIPVLVKNGFKGPIYCSRATYALCAILLVDSGAIQEEKAKKYSSEPLYTIAEAENSLHFFKTVDPDVGVKIGASFTFRLIDSYHILGASFIILSDGKETLTFSGDLGRPHQLIMKNPPSLQQTDYLVLESTYGDRLHHQGDPIKELGDIVNETVAKGGVLIIPSFAVGRAQTIMYCLYELRKQKMIPDIPIFLDSPMAIKVTNLFCTFSDEHQLSGSLCNNVFKIATYIPTAQESKRINAIAYPAIIIAGSGMAAGGRVLDHLKEFISDAKNTILFVGFQAEATGGRSLVGGEKEFKLDDHVYTVQAEIKTIDTFSAHADYEEILEWLSHFEKGPKKVFLTHGEKEAAQSLQKKIEEQFGWTVVIPKYLESFDLD